MLQFLIPLGLQPNPVDLGYFKLLILLDQIIYAWNIKGLDVEVEKYREL